MVCAVSALKRWIGKRTPANSCFAAFEMGVLQLWGTEPDAWGRQSAPRRLVRDLPLWGRAVTLDIEYGQLTVGAPGRRMERLAFVDPGMGYTHRFCHFVSQLCRHIRIDAGAHYTGLAWRTIKSTHQRALTVKLLAQRPRDVTGVRYIGVDEVARPKGHDYRTAV